MLGINLTLLVESYSKESNVIVKSLDFLDSRNWSRRILELFNNIEYLNKYTHTQLLVLLYI